MLPPIEAIRTVMMTMREAKSTMTTIQKSPKEEGTVQRGKIIKDTRKAMKKTDTEETPGKEVTTDTETREEKIEMKDTREIFEE